MGAVWTAWSSTHDNGNATNYSPLIADSSIWPPHASFNVLNSLQHTPRPGPASALLLLSRSGVEWM